MFRALNINTREEILAYASGQSGAKLSIESNQHKSCTHRLS